MKGTMINAAAILVGSGMGLLLKSGMPERYQQTIMNGLGLSVGIIGLEMAIKTQNILIVIISMVVGAIVGEKVNLDKRLTSFGDWLTSRLGSRFGDVGKGFVTASLVFCVGAMAIVGSMQDGLSGDAGTLIAKAMLDGVASLVFASTMGVGVMLSSASVFLYQGTITLLAEGLRSVLSDAAIREMSAVGGLLITGIGMMLLEVKTIKVANLIPAIPVAAIITLLWPI